MSRSITFPITDRAFGIRTNRETGVEIHNDGSDGYAVRVPTRDPEVQRWSIGWTTLAAARREAIAYAEIMRDTIAADYVEAVWEHVEREYARAKQMMLPVPASDAVAAAREDIERLNDEAFDNTLKTAIEDAATMIECATRAVTAWKTRLARLTAEAARQLGRP
jgi:hypothetical protein